jgi:stage II sporulation protein D
LAITCSKAPPPAEVAPVPGVAPGGGGPEIRIGLAVAVDRVTITSEGEFEIRDAEDGMLARSSSGALWVVTGSSGRVAAAVDAGVGVPPADALAFLPAEGQGPIRLNGRAYRGRVVVVGDRGGLTAVNHVALEDYLAGVVSAEMGRRDSSDLEALRAQAVVSRTFAVRNLGKRAALGFDLLATVVDQVYGGIGSETALGWEAVRDTRGEILTYDGSPIDAFFYSTCGGRTAAGTEVFVDADRPYLVSRSDRDPQGQAYCRLSPRFRWRVAWSGEQLRQVMRQSLPSVVGTAAEEAATVQGVRVSGRTNSDRVGRLAVALARNSIEVTGPAVRQVLRPVGEPLLRSAAFTLTETRRGGRLDTLVADGSGAGHGVGFCQWGAVGRARAGQNAEEILTAYFPGTALSRAY